MTTFFISVLGYMIIFASIEVNRKDDSRIPLFSRNWFLIVFLVIIGTSLIKFAYNKDTIKDTINNSPVKTEQTITKL